jgi:predicted O-methyltransferase YrrM
MDYPNWFEESSARNFFDKHLLPLAGQKLAALQIGAYTGDASRWMLDNFLTHPESTLTDVDTWGGSDEAIHREFNWQDVERTYDAKVRKELIYEKVLKVKGTSDDFFASNTQRFDFVYVDGDHKASSVLRDGINAIKYLVPGGIIAFDDYLWESGRGDVYDPRTAIQAINYCYADELEVLDVGAQVWVRKKP